ncbi:ABC transporter substrate-binding protein [Aurantimonas aggregata]|uniref:ABC transporter substrate-binding protein n=1 Tax=Aurantimonas aggregata TaxID=2047720 RepID=A0A6L9MIE5_9HYPH|nr:ABC transporter substrate-binding protein [Aurantimonas aggregata]
MSDHPALPGAYRVGPGALGTPTRRRVLGGLLAAPFVLRSGVAFASPLRVASLDFALAEQMIVLGAPPIALADAGDWQKWVAEPPLPAATVDIGTGLAPNVELLAALKPDLIVTSEFTAMTEPQVSRVAPVERFAIYSQGGSPLPKAMDAMRRLGTLLGREAEAEAYLADTDRFFAACAERAKRFRDKPILMLSFMDPRHVRVYARPGMQQDVMDRLGLRNAWQGEGIYWGFATIGVERLAEIGEATAVADYMPDDVRRVLETSPLWRSLPLRRDGGPVPILPTVAAFGGVATARRLATLLLDVLERQAA